MPILRRRYTIALVKRLFEEAGCQLLEDDYRDNKLPMCYRCRCGKRSQIALQDFLRGVRCGCGRKTEGARRRHSIEYVKQYFASHGCKLLEDNYSGIHKPLLFKCECGREGRVAFADFQNGVRCGCRRHLGLNRTWTKERVIAELEEQLRKMAPFHRL